MKKTAKLENWILGEIETTRGVEQALFGECYNHPDVADGHRALTSHVLSINPELKIAETRNTIYELGSSSELHRDDFTSWQALYRIRTQAWKDACKNLESHEESGGQV